ncbi:MAG: ethylbenzene dehydrogenase-related protein [Dehalococcoidia bacterium]
MAARLTGSKGWWVLLAVAAVVAALLTLGDVRLASSQAVTLTAVAVEGPVPLDDPNAAVWDEAMPVAVPLSAQTVARPMGGTIRSLTARALHDGETLFVRVEWDDATQDLSANAVQEFRDAVAVELPSEVGATVPSFCMGQLNARVNIWHWKADWQAAVDGSFVSLKDTYPNMWADLYPFQEDVTYNPGLDAGNPLSVVERTTPVENLVAGGFGSLTSADVQPVQGVGRWQGDKWRVLFARSLKVEEEGLTQLEPGVATNIAFAVWDGSAGERDGQKSVSQFVDLELQGAPPPAAAPTPAEEGGSTNRLPLIIGILAASFVVVAGWMIIARRLQLRGRGG